MSFCKKCGSALAEDVAFCGSCGTAVAPSGASVPLSGNAEQERTPDGLDNREQTTGPSQPATPAKKNRIRVVVIVCAVLVVVAVAAIAVAINLSSGGPAPEGESADLSVSASLAADESDQDGAVNDADGASNRGDTQNDVSQVAGAWEAVAMITADMDEFVPVDKDFAGAIIEDSGQVTLTLGKIYEGTLTRTTKSTDDGDPVFKLVLEDGTTFTVLYTLDGELLTFGVDSKGSEGLNAVVMQKKK